MSEGAASEKSGAVSLGPRNTERFVLRRFVEADAPLLAAMNMDAEVMRCVNRYYGRETTYFELLRTNWKRQRDSVARRAGSG